ncbi:MAG TPA: Na+/H+ antiporter NhaC [Bacteroidota bacterium]|nr:Na+/H+ antiporter NhaC [Bacteroidota bacterium]
MQSTSQTIQAGTHRSPTLLEASTPLLSMAVLLGVGYGVYHFRIEMLLLATSGIAGLIALRLRYTWKEMEDGIMDSIRKGMPAMSIVIIVGVMIASWIASGSIPMLIYYGLQLISPDLFLLTACLVCSVVSLLTGTSYGTAGTVGIAFMGIAQGMGIPPGPAAGAVVAGAYFGDKISPFSDSTNLAAAAVKCNLYDHIPHLLWTTTPAYLLGLLVYWIAGGHVSGDGAGFERIQVIQSSLSGAFVFHWTLLLPPVLILYLTIRKKPPVPGMLLSSLVALILAVWLQGLSVADAIGVCVTGYKGNTGLADVDKLISRGGMQDMMDVTLIAFCAFAFAGIMTRTGMLTVILHAILRFARTTGRLIASTVAASIATSLITGSSFLSVLIPGELFAPAYKERNLAAKNLSRTTEDSGTVVVPLIPWSIAGVYMSATLAVPTLEYAPWAIMCYTGFLFALLYGFTGFAIAPRKRDDETIPGS